MSCSSEQRHILFDFATGELPVSQRARVEEHVAHCASCRAELEDMRGLVSSLDRLGDAMPYDMSEGAAAEVMSAAAAVLHRRPSQARPSSLSMAQEAARRRNRRALGARMLIPMAAAAAVIAALYVGDWLGGPGPAPQRAVDQLYRAAKSVATVEGINELEPAARSALDEAMVSADPDPGRVADLQLVHYITVRALEPKQIEDVHFMLALLQDDDRKMERLAARPGLMDLLSRFETKAMAAELPSGAASGHVRRLMLDGKYEEAYRLLAADRSPQVQPLAAYAAVRAGLVREAKSHLDAMVQMGLSDRPLVEVLRAETAMLDLRYDLAMKHFAMGAEDDSRLWFQAGYLCKYELNDDAMAGHLFARTGDDRVAAHIEKRFGKDVRLATTMGWEDFESYPVGSAPQSWKLDPTQRGLSQIVSLDGSQVLRQNEMGRRGGRPLTTGYPGWSNYTVGADFKVLDSENDPDIEMVAYELGLSHYALRFEGDAVQLVQKNYRRGESRDFAVPAARATLPGGVRAGGWWHAELRVQNAGEDATEVTARVWPRGHEDQVRTLTWTDRATDGWRPLRKGRVGFQTGGVELAIDNLSVTANDAESSGNSDDTAGDDGG